MQRLTVTLEHFAESVMPQVKKAAKDIAGDMAFA